MMKVPETSLTWLIVGLVLASPMVGEAQVVTALQRAHLVVVDANNKLLGYAPSVDTGPTQFDRRIEVTIGIAVPPARALDSVVLELAYDSLSLGPQRFAWTSQRMYYESGDCTGQAFVWVGEIHGIIGARFGVVGEGHVLFVSVRDPVASVVSTHINSYKDPVIGCVGMGDNTIEGYAVFPTVDLDTVWQAPFRVK